MRLPKKLIGISPFVQWANALVDWLAADRLVSVVGGKLQATTTGRTLVIDPGGGGLQLVWLLLSEVKDDYLVCHSWDGTTEGVDDVFVAKTPKLRNSITEETLDGTDYEYSYTVSGSNAFVERVSTNTDTDETEMQRIVPRYIVGDEIFAVKTSTGIENEDAEPIGLLDLNLDARAWAAQVSSS